MDWIQDGTMMFYVVTILVILGVFVVLLLLLFLSRKNKLILDKERAKQDYERELARTQIEIREATLQNISWELHDNIGQILTLAKIQAQNAQDDPDQLQLAIDSIGSGLSELRALSKIISPTSMERFDLDQALEQEITRFNRLGVLEAQFAKNGESIALGPGESLILFRIVQEFFTNTIKYAKASLLSLVLDYRGNELVIKAYDNGIGFDIQNTSNGLGMQNMKNRAQLIGADYQLNSQSGHGTQITIKYKISSK